MQCPSCRSEISENQFYCPICRASVYSYTPENSRSVGSSGQVGRAGKRLLDVLLLLILIGAGIVIGRAIKWNELLSNFLPGFQAQPATKSERQPPTPSPNSSSPNSPGKQRASEPSKDSKEKPADSPKPASAESVRDLKQKIEELPTSGSSGETKPTPKSATQPTPKPPTSNN